jgi:predicted nucleic acid-binding protein
LIELLVDSSVLIKWFKPEGELELPEARAVLEAHQSAELQVLVLNLSIYEVGNVLVQSGWSPEEIAAQLDELERIVRRFIPFEPSWRREAALLAVTHGLSYYDAAFAACARGLDVSLVSADRKLLGANLAESVTDCVARLRLRRRG